MKRTIAALACVAVIGHAQAFDPRILMPSPVSIALTVGQWMMKDRVETYYLRVKAAGRDEQDARDQAFRLAVNQAIGSLTLSETQVRNGELQRHEIINYSSGYIHDFKILDRYNDGRDMVIEIDVWVRKSQIADRLLNKSADAGSVEGGRISQQIESLQHQRATGDRVLATVLADFPTRAFDVAIEPTQVVFDRNRQGILKVPFHVRWNSQYIASLSEAVTVINQRGDCGRSWLKKCRHTAVVHAGHASGYFDDTVAQDLMHREMIISRPMVKLTILDNMGATRFQQCFSFPELDHSNYSPHRFTDIGPGIFTVNHRFVKRFEINLNLSTLPAAQLDRVDLAIVRGRQC